jgi:hypothetical protein
LPREIIEALVVVSGWAVDWRYEPSLPDPKEAERFLAAAESICQGANERL